MKTMTLAAASLAMSGAFLLNFDTAFAKGPLDVETGQSPLVLVKESATKIDLTDFPFGLEEGTSKNVELSFEQNIALPEHEESVGLNYSVLLPSLTVEKDGDDEVTVTFPDEYTISMTFEEDGENVTFDMDGKAENQVMTFERDGDRMTYTGSADAFSISLAAPEQAKEEGIDFLFTMTGKGLSIDGAGAAEQDWSDLQALNVSYEYVLDESILEATGIDDSGQEFEFSGSTGVVEATGKIGEGRLEGRSEMNDFAFQILQPLPIEASIGLFTTEFGMPTEPSPKPQGIKYLIGAEDIVLDDFIWGLMDPNSAFPRDLNNILIDVEMQAMLMVSLLDPAAMVEIENSDVPPILPTGVQIKSIAFDGLGLTVDATGEGELNGTQPEGEAFISIKGLSEFVGSAVEAGLFGQQESLMIEGMAGQLGKEGDDGALLFDIKTDGGMLNVNDAPIMPIPGFE